MQRVPFQQIYDEFYRVLVKNGFVSQNADLCARIFAESTRDGVHSHSLNRFPSFVQSINSDFVDIGATPERVGTFGALEQWDGRMGIGLLNASFCMDRALALARENGLGCVALKNTNHWMRAGSYGLQAADAGCIGICWTNTTRLMPPWGSAERRLGNNPLVVAVPRAQGHIILDMAMSQFANGKLQIYRDRGEDLPVEGGYDREGQPTTDAGAILDSQRPLPIGYWKGSGLAFVLDLIATLLSGGQSTQDISRRKDEARVSQVFIALDVQSVAGEQILQQTVDAIVNDLHEAAPLEEGSPVTYPGERMLKIRQENLRLGVLVDPLFWQQILDL